MKWVQDVDGVVGASGAEGKGDYMITCYQEKGIELTPPCREQWKTPTSRPRNPEAEGRQIDMVGTKHARARSSTIHVDSFMQAGADHGAVSQVVLFQQKPGRTSHRTSTQPRLVKAGPLPLPAVMSQEALEGLAEKHTKPWPSQSYVDPHEVKVYYQVARECGTSEAWKRAHRERAEARKRWRATHVGAACKGNWGSYRVTVKKGATGWEDEFANATPEGKDPHDEVHKHLQAIYQGVPLPEFPEREVGADFMAREALRKGARRKSAGGDKVPHELLVAIGESEEGTRLLVDWFTRMLHGEPHPKAWEKGIMVLIPKITHPTLPKHVRPICLASYCRLLLERTRGSAQILGSGAIYGRGPANGGLHVGHQQADAS